MKESEEKSLLSSWVTLVLYRMRVVPEDMRWSKRIRSPFSCKRLRNSSILLAGFGCDFEWPFGDSGKPHVVAGQHSSNAVYRPRLARNTACSHRGPRYLAQPRPFLLGCPMLTSNRSGFRPYTRTVSVTISNRRVRARTHGGVAGVGGRPPPRCRSNVPLGNNPSARLGRENGKLGGYTSTNFGGYPVL